VKANRLSEPTLLPDIAEYPSVKPGCEGILAPPRRRTRTRSAGVAAERFKALVPRSYLAAMCALAASALLANVAFGQSADRPSISSVTRRVQVNLVAGVCQLDDFDSLLIEWFGPDGPDLDVRRLSSLSESEVLGPASEPDILRIWVTLVRPNQAQVYFADAAGHRFFLRDVPLRTGLDEVGREQLAQVIVTSVIAFSEERVSTDVEQVERALQSSRPKVTSQVEAPKTSEPKDAPAARRRPWLVRVGGFYGFTLEHWDVLRHGPGVLLGLTDEGSPRRFTINLSAQYLWQTSVDGPDIALRLQNVALRSTLGLEHCWAKLGTALDYVKYDPQLASAVDVSLRGGAAQWRPGAMLGFKIALSTRQVWWAILASATAYLTRTEYDILRSAEPQVQYAPYSLQPQLALQATWR
jgi:hypothetical protein